MKSKVFFAALLSAMLVAVSGCGGSANSPASSNDETTAEQTTEETTETTEAEETETEDDGDAAFDPDWWREYTDSVGKLTTDLDFMGLGLAMPLDWNELIPQITDTNVSGRPADKISATDLTAEEMLTTDLVISGSIPTVDIDDCTLDFNPGLSDDDRREVPLGECVSEGRFVLSTVEYNVRQFFGIPEDAKPEDSEYSNEEYWLLTALMDKYGQPDYYGDFAYGPALYWARDGYYFGCMLFYVPSASTMQVTNATYVPASAWDWFNNDYLVSCGWEPLVAYEAK